MTAAKDTLTYNYGETPEEVIRERLATADSWPTLVGPYFNGVATGREFKPDDLLTVLDGLHTQSLTDCGIRRIGTTAATDGYVSAVAARLTATPAGSLRISILSALGIEEA